MILTTVSVLHKKLINFGKQNTNFCLNLHYNHDNSYFFVNGNEIDKFRDNNKNDNIPTHFFLESISY